MIDNRSDNRYRQLLWPLNVISNCCYFIITKKKINHLKDEIVLKWMKMIDQRPVAAIVTEGKRN